MKILPQVFPVSNALTTDSLTKNSHALFEGCFGKLLRLLPHPLYGSIISIWCCLDKILALILLFSRHLAWIWTVEGLKFSFFCPIRSQVLWFGCLPVTEWQLGHGLGCFYLVSHLIPGRPFCLCVMSQVTLMGKAIVPSAKSRVSHGKVGIGMLHGLIEPNSSLDRFSAGNLSDGLTFLKNKSSTLYSSRLLLDLKSRGPHTIPVWAVLPPALS